MNVLMITTHFDIGGITTYVLTVSRYLVKLGCRVTVISSGGYMVDKLKAQGVEHITMNIRTKSGLSPKLYFALPQIRKVIKERQIDVIHAQTRVAQVMAAVLRKTTRCVYVSTCHGFYKMRIGRRLFPCWGDAVIAISPLVKEHLICDQHQLADRVHMIRNGVDHEQFMPVSSEEKQSLRNELNFSEGRLIGMVSRFCPLKGHSIAVEAMSIIVRAVPEARLVLVGNGRLESEIQKKVQELGIVSHVHFLDREVQPEKVFPAFDCYIMPSLQEGLGLSLMEAQACGLAVVASCVGGLRSLIEDGRTGLFVAPNDARQLAEAVIKILKDKELARALGIQAREFIEREGSADAMVRELFGVYKSLTEKKS